MHSCDEYRLRILRYLDNELSGTELEEFSAHIGLCAHCGEQLREEQALSRLLRKSRPLYSAPEALRARVSRDLMGHPETGSRIGAHVLPALRRWATERMPWRMHWRIAAAVLLIALGAAFVPSAVQRVNAASYEVAAVASHRSYVNGTLRLEVQSASPEVVTAWFAGKVPFLMRLPASQSDPRSKAMYRLTGAALVGYKKSHAALITYETVYNQKISLLIAPCTSAAAAGGEEVRSGSLVFHYHGDGEFKVITWSTRGLVYALVSTLSGSAKDSCLVCHEGMADHQAFTSSTGLSQQPHRSGLASQGNGLVSVWRGPASPNLSSPSSLWRCIRSSSEIPVEFRLTLFETPTAATFPKRFSRPIK